MFEYSDKYKLTFKKDERNTGLAARGQMIGAAIKYRKKQVGRIHRNSLFLEHNAAMYKVGFTVNKSENSVFDWVYFNRVFDTIEEAQEWASVNFKAIVDNFQSKGWAIHELEY